MTLEYVGLIPFGWNESFELHFRAIARRQTEAGLEPQAGQELQPQLEPARVASHQRDLYTLYTATGSAVGYAGGRMRRGLEQGEFIAVGDWVAVERSLTDGPLRIVALLPRFSRFSRKKAGQSVREQIVGANADLVLIVMSLNQDFNLRRLERYLVLAWESGANPVVVLTKADLCPDGASDQRRRAELAAGGVPVHVISVITGEGIPDLTEYFLPGRTLALVGSSGVGKSTLVNAIAGEPLQQVSGIRESDGRGRHTTTRRDLIVLKCGALVLDTPGMRELQMWDGQAGLAATFEDIEDLASLCRFRDCAHQGEPGCAVSDAYEQGVLDSDRLHSYEKLQKEVLRARIARDRVAQTAQKERWKKLCRMVSERAERKRNPRG